MPLRLGFLSGPAGKPTAPPKTPWLNFGGLFAAGKKRKGKRWEGKQGREEKNNEKDEEREKWQPG